MYVCMYIYIYIYMMYMYVCIYIYIYIYIYISIHTYTYMAKRVLEECGVRAPVFYGNPREQTGESGFPRWPTGSLFCSYRNLLENLRKPPGVYGRMYSRNPVITPVPSEASKSRELTSSSGRPPASPPSPRPAPRTCV